MSSFYAESSQTGHDVWFSENKEHCFSRIRHFLDARIISDDRVSDGEVSRTKFRSLILSWFPFRLYIDKPVTF